MLKRCCECKRELELADFHKNRARKDGLAQACKGCNRARSIASYAAHADARRAYALTYSRANKERIREHKRGYVETHRGEAIVRTQAWYRAHKPRIALRERVIAWQKAAVTKARSSAKLRGQACTITREFVAELFEKQHGRCYWTGVSLVPSVTKRDPQRPSVDRLDNDIGYVPGNVVLCTAFANAGRSNTSTSRMADFMMTNRLRVMASAYAAIV